MRGAMKTTVLLDLDTDKLGRCQRDAARSTTKERKGDMEGGEYAGPWQEERLDIHKEWW